MSDFHVVIYFVCEIVFRGCRSNLSLIKDGLSNNKFV